MFADLLVDSVAGSAVDRKLEIKAGVVRKLDILFLIFGDSLPLEC